MIACEKTNKAHGGSWEEEPQTWRDQATLEHLDVSGGVAVGGEAANCWTFV